MEAPSNAIETTGSMTWVEDGMVKSQPKGTPSTGESVTEVFAAIRSLTSEGRRPLLIDARMWPNGDTGAWTTAIANFESTCTAVAMLIDPESPPTLGSYPETIDRLLIPFRVFTEEAEAVAFLRTEDRSAAVNGKAID